MPSKASLRSSPSTLSTMQAGGAELCRRARCVRSYCGKLRCGVYRAGRQWQTVDAPCCSLLLLGLRVNDDDEERPPAAAGQREAVLVTAAMVQAEAKDARTGCSRWRWLAGWFAVVFAGYFVAAVCVATGHRSPGTLACVACDLWSPLQLPGVVGQGRERDRPSVAWFVRS
jgi:hypothetical protein